MNYRYFFKIFSIGAIGYSIIEILWRGYTHWSMAITGGFCFSALYRFYTKVCKKTSRIKKCFCGGIIITATEFIAGIFFNKFLKLNVWDYSKNRFNISGQICLLYSVLWCILCYPVTFLCKAINKT